MQATSDAPILVIETGRPVRPLRRHGGFAHWIRTAAALPRDAVVAVDVQAGARLPARDAFAGVIVTGSAAMVTERLDWSERTAAWLRDAAHAGLPLFGICYGHQLLAHALGGTVGPNSHGRAMGTVPVSLLAAAADDPLFARLETPFAAQVSHLQCVLQPPDGAMLLATSPTDPHHAFRWGERAWGVQFHPEFSATHMRGYIDARAAAIVTEGIDPAAMRAAVSAAPMARRVMRRFVRLARGISSA